MKAKISVIVPTYGRFDSFKKLVKSLDDSSVPKENLELIVVSSDPLDSDKIQWIKNINTIDTQLFCEADRKSVRNRSLYYYENVGIKNAKYDWILVCNDDMWFEPDWYEKFIGYLEDSINVYLVSSHIGFGSSLRIPSIGTVTKDGYEDTLWLFDMTIINRSVYEKVNYLDENIYWYGKGADLSLAVKFLTEEKIKLCHDVKINHDLSHEHRGDNISTTPNGDDFVYIREKWNRWINENNKSYSYVWI